MYKSAALLAAFAATTLAHGTVQGVTIDGVWTGGFKLDYYYAKQNGQTSPDHIGWYAEDLDNGFVEPTSYGEADIICHKNASPEGSSDSMAKVAAGGTVEFAWTAWPSSHVGPVITYVAPYTGDIASVDKTTLKWAKIDAHGYEDGEWAAVKMIAQNNTWPVTVPSTLKAGKYVFRHEIIALHSAQAANGAQNYPQCLNIEVTGSGTAVPDGVVGTELYTENEDGIIFNPYTTPITYTMPGPALWDGASSSNDASTSNSTTTSAASASASASTVASASASASAVASASASASAVVADEPTSSASPVTSATASAVASASASATAGSDETYTLESFIAWLEEKSGSAATQKMRRHARSFL